MKKTILFCIFIYLIIAFSGCSEDTPAAEPSPSEETSETDTESPSGTAEEGSSDEEIPLEEQIVASVGDHMIQYSQYDMTLRTYETYYDEMGFNVRENEDRFKGFQERTLDSMIENLVIIEKSIAEGYDDLDDEEAALLKAEIDDEIASLGDVYQDQIRREFLNDPSIDKEAREKELIAAESYYYTGMKMTYEEYLDYIRNYLSEAHYVESLKKDTVSDAAVSEEQVKEFYDEQFAADREAYSLQPEQYQASYNSDTSVPPLFAPEGYSRVYSLYFKTADSDDDTALKKAEDAKKRIDEGTPFTDVMEETGITPKPLAISNDYSGDVDWETGIKEAFALLSPGECSSPIKTSSGYYMIYYIDDIAPGEYGYENAHDLIYDQLLTSAQNRIWDEKVDEWVAEADVTINEELMYQAGK